MGKWRLQDSLRYGELEHLPNLLKSSWSLSASTPRAVKVHPLSILVSSRTLDAGIPLGGLRGTLSAPLQQQTGETTDAARSFENTVPFARH